MGLISITSRPFNPTSSLRWSVMVRLKMKPGLRERRQHPNVFSALCDITNGWNAGLVCSIHQTSCSWCGPIEKPACCVELIFTHSSTHSFIYSFIHSFSVHFLLPFPSLFDLYSFCDVMFPYSTPFADDGILQKLAVIVTIFRYTTLGNRHSSLASSHGSC